jgi:hypothetical protein
MADDHDKTRRLERAGRVDEVGEERPAAQGMEHLGKRGLHAFTSACCQNHDIHVISDWKVSGRSPGMPWYEGLIPRGLQ